MNAETRSNLIQGWLNSICNGNKPEKPIAEFKISLSFSTFPKPLRHSLTLYGVNRYQIEANHVVTRIDFQPTNMTLWLPPEEYEDLSYEHTKEKVGADLQTFMETERFKSSFLSDSKISTGFSGVIWSK
jgi:hypothetical protein